MTEETEEIRADRVRVLHLITRFLQGGAETTTEQTLEALADAPEPYDLRLGTGAAYDSERLAAVEKRGVETVVFRLIRHYNPVAAILAVFTVAWYLWREDVHVLHTHSTEAGIIGRWAGYLVDTPVVIHEVHGDPIAQDRNPLLNAVLVWLERTSAPATTRIVVKSERIRETYLARGIGDPDQYELVYHGVDTERFENARANGERGAETNPVRILFVGRLADGKGLFDLLDAVARLDADVTLEIVGDGPLADDLAAAVRRRGLDDIVTLHGYRSDVERVMAGADVFALPSYREGTPRVVTEARAAGLPVVATDIAGLPEMVRDGETGFLVEPGAVDALRDRLARLVQSPELRRRMGERARDGLAKFERETAAEAYRELYRSVLDSPSSSR